MEKLKQLVNLAHQLDPDENYRSDITAKAGTYASRFLQELPKMPGYRGGTFEKLNAMKIDDHGKSIEQLLEVLQTEVDAIGINTASGKHMGFIPGGGLWASSVADMLAATTNRYAGIAYSNPGTVKIETQVIDWLVSVIGYPEEAHGNLTSGGSTANLIAIKAARDYHHINASNVKKSVIYFTQQTHHCIHKALHVTGLYEAVLRVIPMNPNFQMDTGLLKQQMLNDKLEGLRPFLVIASAGTTDTGAVDPMNEIADICAGLDTWFHVDAAYGGFFMLVDEIREKLKGIERSDSVVLDPHKTLFIPYGSGAVLVRDRNILLSSNSHKASYMKDSYGIEDINPADTGIELTRHNRGLRMWLPLQLHGVKPFKAALEEKLLLSRYFYQQISKLGFETGPAPDLSVIIFRCPDDDDNSITLSLLNAIHADGRVYLSSTTINEKLWIRCAIVSHRTHLEEVSLALRMIEENIRTVGSGKRNTFYLK